MSLAEFVRPSVSTNPYAPPDRPTVKRWTREEYYELIDLGAFNGKRLERVYGELIDMAPMKDRHATAISFANRSLLAIFPPATHTIRIQCPMTIGPDHDPKPD